MISNLIAVIKVGWHWQLIVLVAGALLPLSFSPFNWWPVSIFSLALLSYILPGKSPAQAAACGFLFAFGMYLSGMHWIFVPFLQYSSLPIIVAALIVFGIATFLIGLFFALPFYVFARLCVKSKVGILLGFPALWVFSEWLRTWLFTGFPWFFLGYGHLNTWLAGWAPVTGVIGVSFIVCFTATTIVFCWQHRQRWQVFIAPVIACLALWLVGAAGTTIQWTQPYGKSLNVGLAQGNISPDKKWLPEYLQPTLDRYQRLSEELWGSDIIVWPEAAIPLIANSERDYQTLEPILAELKEKAVRTNTALMTGILVISPDSKIYNSIMATGLGQGLYFKQRLVPLGEYAPLEEYLGGVFNFFNIPRSMIAPGPADQHSIQVGATLFAPFICYEAVYPDLIAGIATDTNALITISNDAWFGRSIGPNQHLQMAQMRALETQRYLIRSTNNGISALVNDRGEILVKSKSYVMDAIEGEIELRQGMTPFMVFGSGPIAIFSFAIFIILGLIKYRNQKQSNLD